MSAVSGTVWIGKKRETEMKKGLDKTKRTLEKSSIELENGKTKIRPVSSTERVIQIPNSTRCQMTQHTI